MQIKHKVWCHSFRFVSDTVSSLCSCSIEISIAVHYKGRRNPLVCANRNYNQVHVPRVLHALMQKVIMSLRLGTHGRIIRLICCYEENHSEKSGASSRVYARSHGQERRLPVVLTCS